MQNEIRRELVLQASQERVYQAIANPELLVRWFPETLEGKYAPGERPIFGFGEHGKNQVYVESARPNEYFAYRWVPGSNHFLGDVLAVPNTLVEFTIQAISERQCKLTLTETGFAALPLDKGEASFKQNSGGWEFMLGRLNMFIDGK
jgi:uncharacterized protein YndB with AHSA1/START domain